MVIVVKMVPKKYLSKQSVSNVVWYIYRGAMDLPEEERITGSSGLLCGYNPQAVIQEMMQTKRLYEAEDGNQLKHIVISFGEKLDLPRKKMRRLIERTVGFWKERYQMYYGVHYHENDKGEPNFHIHIMLNTVNMKNGGKMDSDLHDWYTFCKKTRRTWEKALKEEISSGACE